VPQYVQVRQREGGIQPRCILRQAAVANFAKTPQALDYMERMLDSGSSSRAATVDEPLILAQWFATRWAPIDTVTNAGSKGALAMRLIPIGLVAEHLSLVSVQQLGHQRAVMHVRHGGAQAVDNAALLGTDVRFHAKVPVFSLLGLAHLGIARLLLVLRRGQWHLRRASLGYCHVR